MTEAQPRVRLGVIKLTTTSRSHGDLEALLPADIETIPEYVGFATRSLDQFRTAMPRYAEKVAALAAKKCDLIHPEGAPPFVVQGLAEESRIIAEWQDRHRVPVFTTASSQVAAMRALGVERFVGYTPFSGELAETFRRYFVDAGFEVLSMGKPVAEDEDVYDLPTDEIRNRILTGFQAVPGRPDVLYILGSTWNVFDMIRDLEAALGVPVLHPVVVRCWYILTQLGRRRPTHGHGRLLAAMPPFAAA